MKLAKGLGAILAAALLLTSVACGLKAGSPTPAPTIAPPPRPSPGTLVVTRGSCGDGICDETERASPDLCPADCPPAPAPPTETPMPPAESPTRTQAAGRCGDGICDEAERAQPGLCPQDCAQSSPSQTPAPIRSPTATLTPTVGAPVVGPGTTAGPTPATTACAVEQWRVHTRGAVGWYDTEHSAFMNSRIDGCITVDASCRIQGTGSGVYEQGDCHYTSPSGVCSYDVTCPDFKVSFSGEKVGDTLRIRLDASQIWEQVVASCAGGTSSFPGSMLQTGYGSAIRNGGGYFCEIEAKDGAYVSIEGSDTVAPLSYQLEAFLYAGCQ
jgi:hypothetical protein